MFPPAVREDMQGFLCPLTRNFVSYLCIRKIQNHKQKQNIKQTMKGLFEILTEKKWMVSPDFVHGIRKALEQNINTHSAFQRPEKTCGFVTARAADGSIYYPEEYQISEDGKQVIGNWALEYDPKDGGQNFPFVSVLTVDGPITRNGGGCSYGSIDHRDMMIKAANHPLCRGHIFLINTPGGSAWAKNDYEQAINYARSLGQPVIAFVDGMCASAGMYLASLCDERYYMHPKNEIGCIGVMAAFYTTKNGEKNQFTGETYREIYDPESFDKNKAFRDIANDEDDTLLVEELKALGVEFRADIMKACPNAKEEHIKGKVFNAEDVKGILMDDQSDFFSCIKRCFALHEGTAEPIHREASTATVPDASASGSTAQTQNTTIDMTNYPLTQAALGVEELAVNEEGTFINAALLDTMEQNLQTAEAAKAEAAQKLADAEKALADAQAHAKEIEEQLATAQADKESADKALADAQEAHSKEIAELNANLDKVKGEHTEAIAKKDEEIATLTSAKAEADEALKGAKEALATAEQTIADKDAQIAELSNDPGNEPAQGAAPQNNGEGAQVPEMKSGIPQFDPANPVESKAAIDAYLANVRKG